MDGRNRLIEQNNIYWYGDDDDDDDDDDDNGQWSIVVRGEIGDMHCKFWFF